MQCSKQNNAAGIINGTLVKNFFENTLAIGTHLGTFVGRESLLLLAVPF